MSRTYWTPCADELSSSGSRRLARAVIERAILDACGNTGLEGNATYRAAKARRGAVRGDAWSFLTSDDLGWSASREWWCDVAGLDPDAVRDRCRGGVAALPTVGMGRDWERRQMRA